MESPASRPHLAWIDFVRFISVFWVIQIHVASPLLYNWGDVPFTAWAAGAIYDALGRACVPLFFMASGYLLLGKQEPLGDFFAKRSRKVLIPFVVWSALYWFFFSDARPEGAIPFTELALTFFPRLLAGPTMYHLWFLYPLLGMYLLVPPLRILAAHARDRDLWYLTGLWFVTASLLPLLENFTRLEIAPEFGLIPGYLGYFLLGYLLGKKNYPPRFIWISGAAYLLLSALMTYITFDLTRDIGSFDGFWFDFLSPLVIVQSLSVFIGVKALSGRFAQWEERAAAILEPITEASFGIYLVHVFTLEWLRLIGTELFDIRFSAARFGQPWYGIPLITVTAFLFSLGLVRFLRRTPLLRQVVP
jgi:surface polysaccharide O-acyltransferase-like enzyme